MYSPGDGGRFRIEVHSTTEQLENPPRLNLELAEISSTCEKPWVPRTIEKHLRYTKDRSFFVQGMRLVLSVTKLPPDRERERTGKQPQALSTCITVFFFLLFSLTHFTFIYSIKETNLKNIVTQIKTFNSRLGNDCPRLSADISGKYGFSVLHAAIDSANADIVAALLQLGANPRKKSVFPSALLFSRRLWNE